MLKPFQAYDLHLYTYLVAVYEGFLLILYLDELELIMIDPLKEPDTRVQWISINSKATNIYNPNKESKN